MINTAAFDLVPDDSQQTFVHAFFQQPGHVEIPAAPVGFGHADRPLARTDESLNSLNAYAGNHHLGRLKLPAEELAKSELAKSRTLSGQRRPALRDRFEYHWSGRVGARWASDALA